MRDDRQLSTESSIYANEDTITDSFPLMIILMTMVVITVFHLFIHPSAVAFAKSFVKAF